MKKAFDILFGIVFVIMAFASVILLIMGFAKSEEGSTMYLVFGFSCMASCVFLIGLSIIVEAAYIYISKNTCAE